MNNEKVKRQFAKLIIVITTIIFLLVCLLAMICACLDKNTDIFCYMIPTSGGVWGASIIWYMKKAQLENAIKIQLGMIEELMKLKKKYNITDTQATEDEEGLEYGDDNDLNELQEKVEEKMQETVDTVIDDALTPPEVQVY